MKKVYQAEYKTDIIDGNYQKHISYFRQTPWKVVTLALKFAEEKTKKEGVRWVLTDLKKID